LSEDNDVIFLQVCWNSIAYILLCYWLLCCCVLYFNYHYG